MATLRAMLAMSGADKIVQCVNGDFLDADVAKYAHMLASVVRACAWTVCRVCHACMLRARARVLESTRTHARALCRYADATAVLCDPSCSGSGQAGAHTLLSGASTSEQQAAALAKLAAQQQAIVLKAMTFPGVETVVCAHRRGIRCAVHGGRYSMLRAAWRMFCMCEGTECVRYRLQVASHAFACRLCAACCQMHVAYRSSAAARRVPLWHCAAMHATCK